MIGARSHSLVLVALGVGTALGACGTSGETAGVVGGTGFGAGGSTDTTDSTSSSSSSAEGPTTLGLACLDDEPCGDDGFCILPTDSLPTLAQFFGRSAAGGPAAGYCSQRCSAHEQCPGAGSLCFEPGPNGFCVLGCSFGQPALEHLDDPLLSDKCQGRDDLACTPAASGAAVCVPACGSDSECPPGRGCDLGVGLCVDAPRQGAPLGAACTPDEPSTPVDDDPCAGSCLTLVDASAQAVAHVCSARCSLGGPQLDGLNCGGPAVGLCALEPWLGPVGDAGLGDSGYCVAACSAHDQCNYDEGLFCLDLGLFAAAGTGYCLRAIACPLGSECADTERCVETVFGPVCLDISPESPTELLFPLGEAAVGTGGAGGAG